MGYYTGGNNVHTNFHNAVGLVSAMSHVVDGSGPTLSYYANAYDAAGNLLLRTEGDGSSTAYTYDAIDQLLTETRTGSSAYFLHFDYDKNHNRQDEVNASGTYHSVYDADDELITYNGHTYTYDNNGNQLTDGTSTETYDDEDRLLTWTGGIGTDTFTYNGLGLRVGKSDSAGSHSLLMDGSSPASPILADSLGMVVLTPGLSENRNGSHVYYHADTLGSTRGITDGNENATDSLLFDAFGETVSRTGSTPTEAGYVGAAGYRTDADSHLMLLGNRYYNPATGRFLSQDPAGSGSNWYDYAANNPLTHTDPTGLELAPGSGGRHDMGAEWANYLEHDNGYDNPNFWTDIMHEFKETSAYIAIEKTQISGSNDFKKTVKDLLQTIISYDFGLNLLSQFTLDNKTLKIKYYAGPNSYWDNPVSNTISFNPDLVAEIQTTHGTAIATPDEVLEHEMGHDISGGLSDPGDYEFTGMYDIYATHGQDNISIYENPYREQKGENNRTDHSATIIWYW